MAGGSGVEWYFGHAFPHMDINCEDFRSRERMWEQTRHAMEFFHRHLPFWEMEPSDQLAGKKNARVLARGDSLYAIQLPAGGETTIELGKGNYEVRWFNPRAGGELQVGSVKSLEGPGAKPTGQPPSDPEMDWVVLIKR
jgi:hypothetical protein